VDRWAAHGTHEGPLGNLKPTGKQIKTTGVDIFRFVDKKIAEGWTLARAFVKPT
jgi:predicted ester cyclase